MHKWNIINKIEINEKNYQGHSTYIVTQKIWNHLIISSSITYYKLKD